MTTGNYIIRQILIKRGNTTVTSDYIGPIGELVLDTDLKAIRVQDGITPGGTIIGNGQQGSLVIRAARANRALPVAMAKLVTPVAKVTQEPQVPCHCGIS